MLSSLRESPNLIISTHLNYGTVARAVRKLTNVPYWLIAHGIDAWNVVGRSRCSSLREADRVLCVSEFTRKKLLAQSLVTDENSCVFPNTFDQERFSPGPKPSYLIERYALTPESPVILTVGRLSATERYKGFGELIEAMSEIRNEIPSARLVIVGDGNARPSLEAKARELRLEKNVTFTGSVGDSELVDHYRLSDLFAMPSRKEGFGIVFLEALSVGKPVIAGNVDASPEAVLNGELGALVNPSDTFQIAQAAISILRREHENKRLFEPEYLRQRAVEAFGFDAFKKRLDQLLQEQIALAVS